MSDPYALAALLSASPLREDRPRRPALQPPALVSKTLYLRAVDTPPALPAVEAHAALPAPTVDDRLDALDARLARIRQRLDGVAL